MKYEFTITLRPQMYRFDCKEQYRLTKPHIWDIFYPDNKAAYNVSCVAELTKEHNIHYHCMINLDSLVQKDKLFNKFRKYNTMFGKKTCTQLVHEEIWTAYMVKDKELLRPLLGDTVVCDFYGVAKMKFLTEAEKNQI